MKNKISFDSNIPYFTKSKFQNIYLEENVTETTNHYQLQYSHSLRQSVIFIYIYISGVMECSLPVKHLHTLSLQHCSACVNTITNK